MSTFNSSWEMKPRKVNVSCMSLSSLTYRLIAYHTPSWPGPSCVCENFRCLGSGKQNVRRGSTNSYGLVFDFPLSHRYQNISSPYGPPHYRETRPVQFPAAAAATSASLTLACSTSRSMSGRTATTSSSLPKRSTHFSSSGLLEASKSLRP